MSEVCAPHHDWFAGLLTSGLILGLFLSYVPQHLRIINKNSSEGFSPWFLLLGSTSSASGMLNMITMQWGIIKCCRVLSVGNCIETTAGVLQVTLQWALFTIILVLYMVYYPPHLKYAEIDVDTHDSRPPQHIKTKIQSHNWRLSIILAWVVFIHMLLITFVTFFLLITTKPTPEGPKQNTQVAAWATFLGVASAILAAIQYAPQLTHTYRMKLVGALSIPMMLIQSPGSVVMVLSIALRPGTNWTSWVMYAVSGIMQGCLLVMCIVWKFRQQRLDIDDFGHPLTTPERSVDTSNSISTAIGTAVHEDIRNDEPTDVNNATEDTPLLAGKQSDSKGKAGWFTWFSGRK